jgi:hypothetical protein
MTCHWLVAEPIWWQIWRFKFFLGPGRMQPRSYHGCGRGDDAAERPTAGCHAGEFAGKVVELVRVHGGIASFS